MKNHKKRLFQNRKNIHPNPIPSAPGMGGPGASRRASHRCRSNGFGGSARDGGASRGDASAGEFSDAGHGTGFPGRVGREPGDSSWNLPWRMVISSIFTLEKYGKMGFTILKNRQTWWSLLSQGFD